MKRTLYVIDTVIDELPKNTVSFEDYLRDYPKLNERKVRVVNLCDTQHYLSQGYYCSLLAEARGHDVLPSVHLINLLRDSDEQGIWLSVEKVGLDSFPENTSQQILICMGKTAASAYSKIASYIFRRFPAPLLIAEIIREENNIRIKLQRTNLKALKAEELQFCLTTLDAYDQMKWQKPINNKKYRWELAMLVNSKEASPPSNKNALKCFVKAGAKLGIKVTPVSYEELTHINQFDALFIRETTAISHHTYRLAMEAEMHGLVVMDDSDSILRCCNKVFLHDAFTYSKVPSLKTVFVNNRGEHSLSQLEQELGYPMVLKLPEGSFSKDVFKVENRTELHQKLTVLFERSALVLAQEYLYTEYDWRVGVLNGRALYSCRYYMARNHWQIYNHSSKRFSAGDFDTLPTFETPRVVLDAALKAAAIIGKGLYGVDLKVHNKKAYVIEVNDNPNIDSGIEDKYLGEELYMQVMSDFLRRLELRGTQ